MRPTVLTAERQIAAPAAVVYHCLADYHEHHRPGGFLPPAFSDFTVLRGGVGAGTVMRFKVTVAGVSRWMTHEVSEPEPGRVLVEGGPQEQTRFTVDPDGDGCRVRIETVLRQGGLTGLFNRLLARRLVLPLYLDELARLERHAQEHGPLPG